MARTRMRRGTSGRRTPAGWGVLACVGLLAVAGPLGAQQARPGWIGISLDILATRDAAGTRTSVRVADVQAGSPAARAGILPGDALIEVNDLRGPEALGALAERLRLSAGDSVRIVVRRADGDRVIRLAAVERPVVLMPPVPRMALGPDPDSVVASIARAMDSLRIRLAERGERVRIQVVGTPPGVAEAPDAPGGRTTEPPRPAPGVWVDVSGAFSPLAPYVLGRNRVAGAEVIDLRPELAGYFGVDGGVLVVDVPQGTLAAEAGLRPGDVIVTLGDVSVTSVEDLRRAVARGGSGAPLGLVRQGSRIRLLLPR